MNLSTNYPDNPPSYEESMRQSRNRVVTGLIDGTCFIRGPDRIYCTKYFLIADFIPWSDNSCCEDLSYLLVRVNDWLSANYSYDVTKCEFVRRMVDSRNKLDLKKCYVFNLSNGLTTFVNQLRLHISIDQLKTEPDHVCVKSYIPKAVSSNSFSDVFLTNIHSNLPTYEDVSKLLDKLNNDINNGAVSGIIINVSTFYVNVEKHGKTLTAMKSENSTLSYIDSNKPKFQLKSLRVFYKPGNRIHGTIAFETFGSVDKSKCLDELSENAIRFISNLRNQNFISMETFPEFEEETRFIDQGNTAKYSSTLVYGDRLIRIETVKVFYFTEGVSIMKPLQSHSGSLETLWIVPRKSKNDYENYSSFMDQAHVSMTLHDDNITDVESIMVPNALTWSQVRHQTVFRYHNENSTNYQFYAIRLIVRKTRNSSS